MLNPPHLRAGYLCALGFLLPQFFPSATASEVPLEAVRFEYDCSVGSGQALFVLGSIPELGCNDLRRAVKMVRDGGSSTRWSLDVGIPQGTQFAYQFVARDPIVSRLADPANGAVLSAVASGATTTPDPPTRDRIVYTVPAGGATAVRFASTLGDVNRPLVPLPTLDDFDLAMLINRPNGGGIRATVFETEFRTPLHRVLYNNTGAYNYIPNPTSTILGDRVVRTLVSRYVMGTRTINGVRGRGIQIYLPRGYADNTWRRYPVLYMHDGQNVFGNGGNNGSWHAEEAADALIRSARIRELIIVAIDYSDRRLWELNPDYEGDPSWNQNYNRFLIEELMPYVNQNFRTLTGPQNTGILGSSFGGIGSISAVLELPGVFGRLGAMSTSFWATNIRNRLIDGEIPASVRIYLDAGDFSDGGDGTVIARDGLIRTGRLLNDNLRFQIGLGQDHSEASWAIRLPDALEALFPITDELNLIDLPTLPRGDVDADGCVNMTDLTRMLSGFGACVGEPSFDPYADVDGTNCVDMGDLITILASYGMACP